MTMVALDKLMQPGPEPPTEPAGSQTGIPASLRRLRQTWEHLEARDRRLAVLRCVGILLWLSIPIGLWLRPQNGLSPFVTWPGSRLVWTLVVALLPLAIVALGYYTWRQICPLMFFARTSEWIGWPDRRSTPAKQRRRRLVPAWVARCYPVITWSFLFGMLALRILLINSDIRALAWTFVGLALLAMLSGFLFTGKAWCNFFCPVSIVEKIYTDGDRPQWRRNSQCPTCTRCKTELTRGLCPDINQESEYWQELGHESRAFAYYAFPGLVLGFYTWYFLHAPDYWDLRGGPAQPGHELVGRDGVYDWGFYLSGDWTRVAHPWRHLMDRGFGFPWAPNIPTVIAAPLTLLVFSLLSYGLFKLAERAWLAYRRREGISGDYPLDAVRHPLFAFAGFLAFNLFYAFAGAPTFRELPLGLYTLFQFGIVVFSASVFLTRLRRTRAKQWKFDQARKWVARWPWAEEAVPGELDEVYHAYTQRAKLTEGRLLAFKDAVQGTLAERTVTSIEIDMLDRLAADMGVGEADQKRILREIGQEYPELLDPRAKGSLGDHLRLIGYRGELERALSSGAIPTEPELLEMQERYRIDPAEHAEMMIEALDPDGLRAEHLDRELAAIHEMRLDLVALGACPAPAARFLMFELREELAAARQHVLEIANLYGPQGELIALKEGLEAGDPGVQTRAAHWVSTYLPERLAAPVIRVFQGNGVDTPPGESRSPDSGTSGSGACRDLNRLNQAFLRLSRYSGRYVQAAALQAAAQAAALHTMGIAGGNAEVFARAREALRSQDALLREAALSVLASQLSPTEWESVLRDPADSVRQAALQYLKLPAAKEAWRLLSPTGARGDARGDDSGLGMETLAENGAVQLSRLQKMFALREAPLFQHLAAEHLYELTGDAREIVLRRGETLFRQGEVGDAVYILLEGRVQFVETREGKEFAAAVSGAGECVGEMSILDPGPHIATARALDPTVRALRVRGEEFRSLIGRDSTTAFGVIRLMIRRQRQAVTLME